MSAIEISTGEVNGDSTTAIVSEEGNEKVKWWKKRTKKIFKKKTIYRKIPVVEWLPKYTFNFFLTDLVAGITVGVTVIPQALAYATVAGLPPEYGLYSAFSGCFIYLFLGSTHAITIGPTALMSLLTYDTVVEMGPEGAALLAFISGCIIFLLGLLNLGFLIDFIATPVIGGFTSASAFTIATTQVKSLLGLKFQSDGFIETWAALFEHIEETRLWDSVMGFSSIAALLLLQALNKVKINTKKGPILWKKIAKRSIWFLSTARNAVVLLVCSIIAAVLAEQGEEDVLLLTGNITAGLPPFRFPLLYSSNSTLTVGEVFQKFGSAVAVIPLIAILESVSIAKAFAKGKKIYASQEMIAIGISNIVGSFFSSSPVTGSFSRTAVNASSGVKTPLNGLYTGSLVLLALSVMTPYFYFIPKSSLAAVICTAVIAMVEVHLVRLIWKTRKIDLIPFTVTFLVCLLYNLEYGILIGAAVNLAMILYSSSRPRIEVQHMKASPGTEYLLITPDRSIVFSSMDYFLSRVRKVSSKYRKPHPFPIVVDLRYVKIADFSTAFGLRLMGNDLLKEGHQIIFTEVKNDLAKMFESIGISRSHIFPNGTHPTNIFKIPLPNSSHSSQISDEEAESY